jgi:hypothetical protein
MFAAEARGRAVESRLFSDAGTFMKIMERVASSSCEAFSPSHLGRS